MPAPGISSRPQAVLWLHCRSYSLEPEVLEPGALGAEVLGPEVLEPEVLEPEILMPEVIGPQVLGLEAAELASAPGCDPGCREEVACQDMPDRQDSPIGLTVCAAGDASVWVMFLFYDAGFVRCWCGDTGDGNCGRDVPGMITLILLHGGDMIIYSIALK